MKFRSVKLPVCASGKLYLHSMPGRREPLADAWAAVAYGNEYWPAQYIVDQNGRIVFEHVGEGQYEEIERTIQKLLNLAT